MVGWGGGGGGGGGGREATFLFDKKALVYFKLGLVVYYQKHLQPSVGTHMRCSCFFLISLMRYIYCGNSLELPCRGNSNGYQNIFWLRKIPQIIIRYSFLYMVSEICCFLLCWFCRINYLSFMLAVHALKTVAKTDICLWWSHLVAQMFWKLYRWFSEVLLPADRWTVQTIQLALTTIWAGVGSVAAIYHF